MKRESEQGTPIPGVTRQTLKEIKNYPVPKFRQWLLAYSDYWLNEGAKVQWEFLKEALHEVYGFGDVRIKRLEQAMCEKLKKERSENESKGILENSKENE